jgi:DNA (cytosine-5)-methyltransferase 1
MLPTPTVSDTFTGDLASTQQKPGSMHSVTLPQTVKMEWEQFEPAIKRWELITGRQAPKPFLDNQKLNPKFTEWLMGLPDGWITDLDISWTQMIKACGNGVVPQQAKLALERLIP